MSRRLVPVLLVLASCPASLYVPDVPVDAGETSTGEDPVDPPPTPTTADPETSDPPTTGAPTTRGPDTGTTDDTTTGTSTDATTADDGTTGIPPACGDGQKDPGEECDAGHILNSNSGHCTLYCKINVCGDGYVKEGVEVCDNGLDNSDFIYGGCSTQCTHTKYCGDGEVNGPEECDLAESNGTGEKASADAVACTASCTHEALLVVLSSITYSAVELAGAYEANARCEELAAAAMLPNHQNFKAWLSDKYSSPFDSFDPPIPGMPYALKNGLRVADDRAQLLATGPLTALAVTEKGQTIYEVLVWTATGADGKLFDDALDCDNWGSKSPLFKARLGHSGFDKADVVKVNEWRSQRQWTTAITLGCDNNYHLYCFEQ
jgi:hypothetical protein